MIPHRITTFLLAIAIGTSAFAATADEKAPADAKDKQAEARAKIEERIAEVKAKLELTEAQEEQITPIIQASIESHREILAKYGIDLDNPNAGSHERLGLRKARQLGKELAGVREDTVEKLEGILSEEQIKTFKKMQEDRRDEMRKRFQERRKP